MLGSSLVLARQAPRSISRVLAPLSRHQTTLSTSTANDADIDNSGNSGVSSAADDAPIGFTTADLAVAKPFSSIPTPYALPFFGNLFSFKPFGKLDALDRVSCCESLYERFGPISRLSLPFIPQFQDWVEILDPADFEIIFRNEGKYPFRPGDPAITRYQEKRRRPLGLFNANHEAWWRMRQPLNKPMMRANSSFPYMESQDPVGNELVACIRQETNANDNKFPWIMSAFQKWSLESVCTVIFDRKLGCMDPNLAADSWQKKFIDSVTLALHHSLSLGINPIHKIFNMVGLETKTEKEFDQG